MYDNDSLNSTIWFDYFIKIVPSVNLVSAKSCDVIFYQPHVMYLTQVLLATMKTWAWEHENMSISCQRGCLFSKLLFKPFVSPFL